VDRTIHAWPLVAILGAGPDRTVSRRAAMVTRPPGQGSRPRVIDLARVKQDRHQCRIGPLFRGSGRRARTRRRQPASSGGGMWFSHRASLAGHQRRGAGRPGRSLTIRQLSIGGVSRRAGRSRPSCSLDAVEPGADRAVHGVAEFLVPLREGLRELGRDIDVQVDGGASSSGPRSPLDDGSRGAAKRGNVGAL